MTRELKSNDCTGKCAWTPTDEVSDGQPIFACSGCGSEWTPDLGWTPRNADGEVSAEVLAAKAAAQPRTALDSTEQAPEGHGGGSVGAW
ncbi:MULTISPECIES: hypothetical protein [unclassified Luteococcus]|uniref:hypothetical protein n=1 Tax=unclassified Luteococcus TaxID=2639923 RepID=UPI00313D1219